jgi:pimeloyl-ACP methyl ester carboxylesterase
MLLRMYTRWCERRGYQIEEIDFQAGEEVGVKSATLIAPFGFYDDADPPGDPFNRRVTEVAAMMSSKPAEYAKARLTPPTGSADEQIEWTIIQTRATEAASRLLWPLGDLGLKKRLHRVTCPVRLVWGAEDRVMPASYAKRFLERLPSSIDLQVVPGAGHALDFDAPGAAGII